MKTYQLAGGLIILAAIMSFTHIPASSTEANRPDERRAVLAANAEFYAALNAIFTGNLKPMTKIWSHTDDITYMGPVGGYQKGWKAVQENWAYQAEQNLGGKVVPEDIHVNTGARIAIVHNLEKGTNVVDGQTQVVSIRATNIFRKEKGQWKMIGHHTDLLPFFK